MADSAALLVDEVLPHEPMRQWVLSVPFPLRFVFASRPEIMGKVLGIVYRTIATHLIKKAGFTRKTAHTGAVTLIQCFGGAPNLNIHLMCMDARMPRAHGCAGATELKTPYRDGTTHVTALAHPALAALVHPCTSSSNRWTSSRNWPPWCPDPGLTSLAFMACWP